MNRDKEHNNSTNRNHYADFDAHGNRRTNRMGDDSVSSGDPYNPQSRRSSTQGADYTKAYGDYSEGTRYGDGGSTYGGGPAYDHTNYGPNHDHGSRSTGRDRNQSEHVRNGYGDYTDYDSRNYGSFAGSSDYTDFMNYNYGPSKRGRSDNRDDKERRGGYGDKGRGSSGYDNSYKEYGNTGYGSTGYNNRNEDRERGVNSRGNYGNTGHNNRSYRDDYNPRDRGDEDRFSYRNGDDRDR